MPGEFPTIQPIAVAPTRPRLLARGITRRCAWCGDRRAYFIGWFRRQDRCRACGHAYRRGDAAFELGALTINITLTFIAILIAVSIPIAITAPDLAVWPLVGFGSAVALIGPLLFYPLSFTLWQAIDLWMRPPTRAELAGEADATL